MGAKTKVLGVKQVLDEPKTNLNSNYGAKSVRP
jgi:hypothetical protein